jgi:hypothetical protein
MSEINETMDIKKINLSKDTKNLFNLLRRFEEDIKVKSIIHYETYLYYKKIHIIFSYPALFLSFIINSALFTNLLDGQGTDSDDINLNFYFTGNLITIICNIIIGLVSFYKLDDLMNDHYNYSKEYTRIYRIICQFYYENLILKDKLKKEYLYQFIQSIQSHIFLLFDDEPKCPSKIVHKVKISNIDISFYVYASKKLKNPYSYENILKLYQLPLHVLDAILNIIETDPTIHLKYPGFYRLNQNKEMPKKEILNYIILEKNISYNDIQFIIDHLNISNLQVIHSIENDYNIILTQDKFNPIIIIDTYGYNHSSSNSTNSNSPNNKVNNNQLDIIKTPNININTINKSYSYPNLKKFTIDEPISNSLIDTNILLQYNREEPYLFNKQESCMINFDLDNQYYNYVEHPSAKIDNQQSYLLNYKEISNNNFYSIEMKDIKVNDIHNYNLEELQQINQNDIQFELEL